MGVMSRIMKSVCFSAAAAAAAASGRRRISSSSSKNDLFLVRRFTHETDEDYFSLISTEDWVTVRDFHSPRFAGHFDELSVSGCNGLVLIHTDPNAERLWNPWMNEFKLLPPSYVPRPPNKHSYSFTCLGFGFDPKSRDYKVLRLVRNYFVDRCDDPHIQQLEVYSLKSDSWKEIYEDPSLQIKSDSRKEDPWDFLDYWNRATYANGCCYWHTGKDNILSFDFATESFSCFSLPKTEMTSRCFLKLVEFDGLLGVIVYVSSRESSFRGLDGELWVWNDESWTKKFEIHVADAGVPLAFSNDNRLLFLRGERERVCAGYERYEIAQLLVCDVSNRDVKKFDIYDYSRDRGMAVFPSFDTKVDFNVSEVS